MEAYGLGKGTDQLGRVESPRLRFVKEDEWSQAPKPLCIHYTAKEADLVERRWTAEQLLVQVRADLEGV